MGRMGIFRFTSLKIYKNEDINMGWESAEISRGVIRRRRKYFKSVKPQLQQELKQAGLWYCWICGSRLAIILHHIKPLAAGGTNDDDNIQALCRKCHKEAHKGTKVLNTSKYI